jgi:hypothetical protein
MLVTMMVMVLMFDDKAKPPRLIKPGDVVELQGPRGCLVPMVPLLREDRDRDLGRRRVRDDLYVTTFAHAITKARIDPTHRATLHLMADHGLLAWDEPGTAVKVLAMGRNGPTGMEMAEVVRLPRSRPGDPVRPGEGDPGRPEDVIPSFAVPSGLLGFPGEPPHTFRRRDLMLVLVRRPGDARVHGCTEPRCTRLEAIPIHEADALGPDQR